MERDALEREAGSPEKQAESMAGVGHDVRAEGEKAPVGLHEGNMAGLQGTDGEI